VDSLKGTILQYHVWSCGTNYSAEDSLGGQFLKIFFLLGGTTYSITGRQLSTIYISTYLWATVFCVM